MDMFRKFWLLWAAIAAIGAGYVTLEAGMLSVGPLLLVTGYCILLPFFLWRSFRRSVDQ